MLLLRDAGVVIEYWEMCDDVAPRDRDDKAWVFFWAFIHYHADLLLFSNHEHTRLTRSFLKWILEFLVHVVVMCEI